MTQEDLVKIYKVYLKLEKQLVQDDLIEMAYKLTPFYTRSDVNRIIKTRAINRFVIFNPELFDEDVQDQAKMEIQFQDLDIINEIFYSIPDEEIDKGALKVLGFVAYVEKLCNENIKYKIMYQDLEKSKLENPYEEKKIEKIEDEPKKRGRKKKV